MKKLILTVCALFAFLYYSDAQTQSELKAARALARQQGYSDTQIDQALNMVNGENSADQTKNDTSKKNFSNPGTGTVVTPPTSAITMPVVEIPEPAFVSPIAGRMAPSSTVFGHDFFISDGLSLIPSINAPVPDSYVIGPGDMVNIDLWGSSSASFSCVVQNDGSISVKGVSPMHIGGTELKDARKIIRNKMSSRFSGLSSGGTDINVTLSKIRGVAVYVVGDVFCPGVYTLPSLSSVATAIYMAGGIMKYGSVRQIKIFRGTALAGTFDLYDFIFKGKYDTNVLLQDGDVISVSSTGGIVRAGGAFNREGLQYEIKKGETVSDIIRYAGGFATDANRKMVHIDRNDGLKGYSYDVKAEDFDTFQVMAGDSVSVSSNRVTHYENRIVITGSVNHPGSYSISDKLTNLRQLIDAAGGLKVGTYMTNGYICRKDKDLNPSSVPFSLERIMNGQDNIDLIREDSVCIFSVGELRDSLTVSIKGELNAPGDFEWRENITIGDLILMAEGLTDGADLSNVEVASMSRGAGPSTKRYNLTENPDSYRVTLSPFDVVMVRHIQEYRPLSTVTITGEVKYPGVYAIDKKNFRLSDLVARASGCTEDAYIKGASLKRLMTEEELEKAKEGLVVLEKKKYEKKLVDENLKDAKQDSIVIETAAIKDTYLVGISLENAIRHPGSYHDIVLRDGDVVDVPLINNTVKISGAVNFPNTVAYNSSFSWRNYISQAGGFKKNARKKVYAVYMDGSAAARGSVRFRMEPGMELIVPEVEVGKNKSSIAEIASLTSAVSSVAYMAAIMVNLFKK